MAGVGKRQPPVVIEQVENQTAQQDQGGEDAERPAELPEQVSREPEIHQESHRCADVRDHSSHGNRARGAPARSALGPDLAQAAVEDRDHLVDLLGRRLPAAVRRRSSAGRTGRPGRLRARVVRPGRRRPSRREIVPWSRGRGRIRSPGRAPCRGRRRSRDTCGASASKPFRSRSPCRRALASRSRSRISREHGEPGGARDRVALEGVPLDKPRVGRDRAPERVGDRPPADHRRQRCITAAQSLGDQEYVGRHAKRLGGEHPARAADARDDLVKDQEDVMPVADFAEDRQILLRRVDHAAGMADRLDQDGRHGRGIFHARSHPRRWSRR